MPTAPTDTVIMDIIIISNTDNSFSILIKYALISVTNGSSNIISYEIQLDVGDTGVFKIYNR